MWPVLKNGMDVSTYELIIANDSYERSEGLVQLSEQFWKQFLEAIFAKTHNKYITA